MRITTAIFFTTAIFKQDINESVVLECNSAYEVTKSAPTYRRHQQKWQLSKTAYCAILILLGMCHIRFQSVEFRI